MKNYNYNGSIEYEKAMHFLETGCKCGCSKIILTEGFAKLCEAFQALSRSEQDIFLMAQLKAMNGGEITASRRPKKKMRTNKRTFYLSKAERSAVEIAIHLFAQILIC